MMMMMIINNLALEIKDYQNDPQLQQLWLSYKNHLKETKDLKWGMSL